MWPRCRRRPPPAATMRPTGVRHGKPRTHHQFTSAMRFQFRFSLVRDRVSSWPSVHFLVLLCSVISHRTFAETPRELFSPAMVFWCCLSSSLQLRLLVQCHHPSLFHLYLCSQQCYRLSRRQEKEMYLRILGHLLASTTSILGLDKSCIDLSLIQSYVFVSAYLTNELMRTKCV
uniref:Uncharacterized protein n=1 Tax=Setaria viridis TaxID=4556 RepID=A0A4U6TAB5_SETVI|nr:hypothetical protein SEVIR_9G517050v2 [Setaria viridis]